MPSAGARAQDLKYANDTIAVQFSTILAMYTTTVVDGRVRANTPFAEQWPPVSTGVVLSGPANRACRQGNTTTDVGVSVALNGVQFTTDAVNVTLYADPVLVSGPAPPLGPRRGGTTVVFQFSGLVNSPAAARLLRIRFNDSVAVGTIINSTHVSVVTPALGAPVHSGTTATVGLWVSLNAVYFTQLNATFTYYGAARGADPVRLLTVRPVQRCRSSTVSNRAADARAW
jgi:hypothetical protein